MLIEGLTVNPKRGAAGTLFHVNVRTRTAAGVLTTPGTSIKFGFYDPAGTLTALTAMTTDSAGVHSYAVASTTAFVTGEYRLYVEAIHTDGTSPLITERGDPRNFEVY